MTLYVDLDDTLISSVVEGDVVVEILVKPGAREFLETLSRHGELVLLTHARRTHVENAMQALGPVSRLFLRIVSREDMVPVIEQLEAIHEILGLAPRDFSELYDSIPSIEPPGVIFDDQPVGSPLYWLKTRVVGVDRRYWIQVDSSRGRKGFEKAYAEYLRRFGARRTALSGRIRAAVEGF